MSLHIDSMHVFRATPRTWCAGRILALLDLRVGDAVLRKCVITRPGPDAIRWRRGEIVIPSWNVGWLRPGLLVRPFAPAIAAEVVNLAIAASPALRAAHVVYTRQIQLAANDNEPATIKEIAA